MVTKRIWGAFATIDLGHQLKARGVAQVVVTEVATSGGVEATARNAIGAPIVSGWPITTDRDGRWRRGPGLASLLP